MPRSPASASVTVLQPELASAAGIAGAFWGGRRRAALTLSSILTHADRACHVQSAASELPRPDTVPQPPRLDLQVLHMQTPGRGGVNGQGPLPSSPP